MVQSHPDKSANAIFGHPDDLKFRSSMPLFARAAPEHPEFRLALEVFFDGETDLETLKRL